MSRALFDVCCKTLLSAAVVAALAACNREAPADAASAPATSASAPAPIAAAPYQRPTADQLYALVSPIALFPDNLVAQTLAASTHPDQVDDARQFVQAHRDLTGSALIDAADNQPWDPSVKSLVAFPAVLDQMANNGEWTGALGQAYANDPSDVMNAIQVMRSRAQAHGNLKSTTQQKVQVVERGAPVTTTTVVEEDQIVGPPAKTIEIEPADPDVVYVPQYDPDVVYGAPVYSGYYETRYVEPAPYYRDAAIVGVVGFGAGILVGELFAHHDYHARPWGWDNWHTAWGGHREGGRPAVVYDNHPYVVNRTVVNNRFVDRSVHIDNRHDFNNVNNRPGMPPGAGPGGRPPGFTGAGPGGANGRPPGFTPGGPQRPATPDYAHMQRPNFTPGAMHATAPNERPAISAAPAGAPGRPGFDQRGPNGQPGFAQRGPNGQPGFDPRGGEHGQPSGAPHVVGQLPEQQPGQPARDARNDARNDGRFNHSPNATPAGTLPAVQPIRGGAPTADANRRNDPRIANAPQAPRGDVPTATRGDAHFGQRTPEAASPAMQSPRPADVRGPEQARQAPQFTRQPDMPRAEPQRSEPQREAPRSFQPPQQRMEPQREVARTPEPQREMQREMPRPQMREQPQQRPQPQEHHEQARPAAAPQQHHDDHKKHD
ncbi:DUF3300 domain-containing protein [Bacillus sp. NP157]|nr:DUF3300 domain-containing protein [Bacillus sp. NP157]